MHLLAGSTKHRNQSCVLSIVRACFCQVLYELELLGHTVLFLVPEGTFAGDASKILSVCTIVVIL